MRASGQALVPGAACAWVTSNGVSRRRLRPFPRLANLPAAGTWGPHRGSSVYWFGVLFASIGAGAILFALTFVSLLIGVVVNAMGLLIAGPLVDRLVARRRR